MQESTDAWVLEFKRLAISEEVAAQYVTRLQSDNDDITATLEASEQANNRVNGVLREEREARDVSLISQQEQIGRLIREADAWQAKAEVEHENMLIEREAVDVLVDANRSLEAERDALLDRVTDLTRG